MTAVVGIMNKRGIAIAADSAVTMTRRRNEKIANSANKMLRLSSAIPVSVMITGSAGFIATPWDIIVRRYRQKRGNEAFPTVEACIYDFMSYIPTEKMFLSEDMGKEYLNYKLGNFWKEVSDSVPALEAKEDGTLSNVKKIQNAFHKRIRFGIKCFMEADIYPMFKDYSIDLFKEYLGDMVNDLFAQKTMNNDFGFIDEGSYPKEILDQIKTEFTECFYYYVTRGWDKGSTNLIFSGYGKEEDYPVLIRVMVDDGFDSRICYQIKDEDIYKISDATPVAICPFAQDDIMKALLTGVDPYYFNHVCEEEEQLFESLLDQLCFAAAPDPDKSEELRKILDEVKYKDLTSQFTRFGQKLQLSERGQWLKALRDYDLQDMARLAENLVAMTSFERHMTFSQEGVGGPIDLAVITKNNGFTWLNRKSWYHHKDVSGRYGKFGV